MSDPYDGNHMASIPFMAVGNDELGDKLGETITCPRCGEPHRIECGKKFNPKTKEYELSNLLQFYNCGNKSFMCGLNGRKI